MKKSFLNYIFFISIILFCLYIVTNVHNDINTEPFTPYIREMYRPYLRHVRIIKENIYQKGKLNIYNIFRKLGVM
jgi:hypothetical protein